MESEKCGNRVSSPGHLFVCCACGKVSTTKYGFDASGRSTASPGWDESCMLSAQEFPESQITWNVGHTLAVEINTDSNASIEKA